MASYYHAHRVVSDKCQGHMTCMRHCPTQAIRVRNGKAVIAEELCVDCGECMSVCPEGAIEAIVDPVGEISGFKYKVVIPSPVLYSQFGSDVHPHIVHEALKMLGFDEVVDVVYSSAAMAASLVKYVKESDGPFPLISSYCPTIVRLIQVKYPALVEQVVPLNVPREVTAREIRNTLPEKLGMTAEDIGIVYLSPCPAQITSIKQPAEKVKSYFDGAISIRDAYSVLLPRIRDIKKSFVESDIPEDFVFHTGWVRTGSILRYANIENWLAVAGLDNIVQILDDIENGRLHNVEFIEALAHVSGCLNGPFCLENPYVARHTNILQREKYELNVVVDPDDIDRKFQEKHYFLEGQILPRPGQFFDTDLETSIKRMKERERVFRNLSQTDCGCCGSPTCMAFAEDFVKGDVKLTDCIFLGGNKNNRS